MGEQAEQEGKGEAVERAKGFPQLFAEVGTYGASVFQRGQRIESNIIFSPGHAFLQRKMYLQSGDFLLPQGMSRGHLEPILSI